VIFFFKQKTAYEIFTRLEFRRVLFRSLRRGRRRAGEAGRAGRSEDPAPGQGGGGGRGGRAPDRKDREGAGPGQEDPRRVPRRGRSEERRVGKAWSARWSPGQKADERRR